MKQDKFLTVSSHPLIPRASLMLFPSHFSMLPPYITTSNYRAFSCVQISHNYVENKTNNAEVPDAFDRIYILKIILKSRKNSISKTLSYYRTIYYTCS